MRQRLDGTSFADMTATVLMAALHGTLRALELWMEGAEWKRPEDYRWIGDPEDEMSNLEVPELNSLGFIMGWRDESGKPAIHSSSIYNRLL